MDAFIGRVVTRHTSCRQNTMHEKLGARWSLLFDVKMAVKSYVIETLRDIKDLAANHQIQTGHL